MTSGKAPSRIVAVLGPTNTGKTHYAIERMLAHGTGMIGFPLRLLARENYDRVVKIKGKAAVALVTGEEKIVPPRARYFLCTVEAMPVEETFDFVGIDEVQMAADPERGHIFTDRLLRARGLHETILIGAETIGPLVRKLLPDVEFMSRPRLSTLTYSGPKKITRLPRRSAVVGFSASAVYELAELMRRRRGGTAVVLGALSPRTRNAQVAMYQAGEVDYLVATDAIGMGLNMDVDHVAFSGLVKYDGRIHRRLDAAELAQIAGRAGRHMNDGTFGTTGQLGALDQEVVEAIENHRFPPLERLFWRNPKLDFRTPAALLRSLKRPSPGPTLIKAREADDQRVLAVLARDQDVVARAKGGAAVGLLWDVCQIPDFRKIMTESHANLIKRIYRFLTDTNERLPSDWVARHVDRADRTDGDIETLTGRIADIRTWTYISHRPEWLEDAGHWQERARAIEDRLSDALHERLTQRFVDKRAAVLVRRLADGADLAGAVRKNGDVIVEGEFVGRLEGFRFVPDSTALREDAKPLIAAANRALREAIGQKLAALDAAPDSALALRPGGRIEWAGSAIGRLEKGRRALHPVLAPRASDLVDGPTRARIQARLERWFEDQQSRYLKPLIDAGENPPGGPVRGILYQLVEGLGAVPRATVADLIDSLKPADRKKLAACGVRIGQETVYFPALQKPPSIRLRSRLWRAFHAREAPLIEAKAQAFVPEGKAPAGYWLASGYRNVDGLAVRIERLERLADEARKLSRQGAFVATPKLRALADCGEDRFGALLGFLGYRAVRDGEVTSYRRKRRGPAKRARGKTGKRAVKPAVNPDSPFAGLRDLVGSK